MPFTFSSETFMRPLAEFGNDSAQMILQTGATIQQGLQQMMTNRQVSALGQQLGQLNPESPEWSQQAVKLGSQYPLAMKSPAGQFMLSTQAKAHAQWQAVQKASAQQQNTFGNQVALEGLKQRNRMAVAATKPGQQMVDLGEITGSQQNPMSGGPGAAMALPSLDPAANEPVTDAQAPLFGMNGGLGDITADVAKDFGGKGKIPASQFFPAVRQERGFRQQQKLLDDRQAQQEKMAEKRDATKAAADEMKAAANDKKAALSEARLQQTILKGQLDSVDREITQHRAALDKHLGTRSKVNQDGLADFNARRLELEGFLVDAGKQATDLKAQLNAILKEEDAPANPYTKGKKYQGMEYLGGDPKDPSSWRK